MASEKISDMPAATVFNAADIFPIVQLGNNLSCARDVLLTAQPGDTIAMLGNGGIVKLLADGSIKEQFPTTGTFSLSRSTINLFTIDVNGAIRLAAQPGQQMLLGSSVKCFIDIASAITNADAFIHAHVIATGVLELSWGATVVFGVNAAGGMTIGGIAGQTLDVSCNSGGMFIDAAGVVTIESGTGAGVIVGYVPSVPADWSGDPTDQANAIDRLAAAVAGLLGVPIP